MPTWLAGQQAAKAQCSLQGRAWYTKGPRAKNACGCPGLRPLDISSLGVCASQPESLQGLWANLEHDIQLSLGEVAMLSRRSALLL